MIYKIKVAVLRGGPSDEYEVSMKSGASVLNNLSLERYIPIDVCISRDGIWYVGGIATKPENLLKRIDLVFNALHGRFGEDGKIQKMLDDFAVPYTGSNSISSMFGMNKHISKQIYQDSGIKTPYSELIRSDEICDDTAHKIFRTFMFPCVVKTVNGGSSIGVRIVKDLIELKETLKEFSRKYDLILVEEFIRGKEATCGTIDNFRGQNNYSLLPIEIVPPSKNEFFDYESKYSGETQEILPGRFSKEESKEIQRLAIEAHKALGLRHYSRSDFIVNPKRGVYILETNTLPGMTEESLFPKSLEAVGSNLEEFLDHLIKSAYPHHIE